VVHFAAAIYIHHFELSPANTAIVDVLEPSPPRAASNITENRRYRNTPVGSEITHATRRFLR
jgi:hypothetical protein